MEDKILSLMTPLISLLFASVFTYLWLRDKSQICIAGYAIGYWMLVVSFVFVIMIFDGTSPLMAVLLHCCAAGGATAILWGAAHRLRQSLPVPALIVTTAIGCIYIYAAVAADVPELLVIAQNGSSAILFAIGAMTIWQSGSVHILDRALVWVLALMSGHGFVRPLQALLVEGPAQVLSYNANYFQAINVVVIGILSAVLAIILMACIATDQARDQKEEAGQDPLTGLPNRAAFEAMVDNLIARSQNERVPLSLIIGDIDNFKDVNDTFGHRAGDAVIRNFGALISSKVRPGDIAGRIGGEEFCIVAWNCTEDGACALADRLRSAWVGTRHDALPDAKRVSASFGVAFVRPGEEYAQAFNRADDALYRAKRAGRNCVFGDSSGGYSGPVGYDMDLAGIATGPIADIVTLSKQRANSRG